MYVGSQHFHSCMCMFTANMGSREHHYVHMVLLHVLKYIDLCLGFIFSYMHVVTANIVHVNITICSHGVS